MHRLECSFAHMWFEEKVTKGLVDKLSFSENENVSVCILQKGDSLCQRPVISKANSLPITFSSVQSLSCVRLFVTPWITAGQASLSITNSASLTKLMSLSQWCHPAISSSVLVPSIFPSIRVYSNESALRIRWPKYWNFSISPFNEYSGLNFL